MFDPDESEMFRKEFEGFLLRKRTRVEFTTRHWNIVIYSLGPQDVTRVDFHPKSRDSKSHTDDGGQ